MLGKTYLQLNDNDKALYYLELAAKYPAKTDSDHQVIQICENEFLNIKKKSIN